MYIVGYIKQFLLSLFSVGQISYVNSAVNCKLIKLLQLSFRKTFYNIILHFMKQ